MQPKKGFSLTLGDRHFPVDIHALAVDGEGHELGGSSQRIAFRFTYRNVPFTARFEEAAEGPGLDLHGDVGPMPYSAESALARLELQTIVNAANEDLGNLLMIADGRILIVGSARLTSPVTAAALISSIVLFLLPLKPYLETFEVFLQPPGEAKTATQTALRPAWRGASLR